MNSTDRFVVAEDISGGYGIVDRHATDQPLLEPCEREQADKVCELMNYAYRMAENEDGNA